MFNDFISSIFFYLLPYLTGKLFIRKSFYAYISGALILFASYFFVFGSLTLVNQTDKFSLVIRALLFLIVAASLIKFLYFIFQKLKTSRFKQLKSKLLSFSAIVESNLVLISLLSTATLLYFFIWHRLTPYPLQLNWDIYEHITVANEITTGHLSFLPSQISDTFTFNGYTPLFHILLSAPKILFNSSFFGMYYFLEYWHYLFSIIGSFLLAKRLFNNIWISTMSGALGGLIFESSIVYTSFFLIPQTLTALLAIFILTTTTKFSRMLLLSLLTLFLMHFVIGPLAILLIILFVFLSSRKWNHQITILLSLLIFLICAGLNFVGRWTITGREEANYFTFSVQEKSLLFFDWYSLFLPVFFIIGAFFIFKSGTSFQRIFLSLTCLAASVSILPFSYFVKYFVIGHFFINLVIAAGIFVVISYLRNFYRIIALSYLLSLLFIIFYSNQLFYKEHLYFYGRASHISYEELVVARYLSERFGQDALLISDPATQYILEASSGINSQGGAYTNISTRKKLSLVNNSYSHQEITENLLKIKDQLDFEQKNNTRVLFIVSGRYFAWQKLPDEEKLSFYINIWKPKSFTSQDLQRLNFLRKNPSFKLLYKNEQLAVFEVFGRNNYITENNYD